MDYIGSAVTDVGIVKKVNQDSILLKIARSHGISMAMAVVCDGVGGLSMGEVASGNMIMSFDKWFKSNYNRTDIEWDEAFVRKEWGLLITEMNDKIIAYGKSNSSSLGTTVTAVMFVNDEYYCIHVGDSRLYEIEKGCTQLTKDQTLVAREVEQGILTEKEALTDSRRNILLQCVGVTPDIAPEFICGKVKPDSSYLVCSDGFRHTLSDNEVYKLCRYRKDRSTNEIHNSLLMLVDMNKTRGERDNISAILIQKC